MKFASFLHFRVAVLILKLIRYLVMAKRKNELEEDEADSKSEVKTSLIPRYLFETTQILCIVG